MWPPQVNPNWVSGSCTAKAMFSCYSRKTKPTTQRLFGTPNRAPYVKDGINNYVVNGQTAAVNPAETGTKRLPTTQSRLAPENAK